MYRQVNKNDYQNKNPDPQIRKEREAEFGGIGNEAIGNLIGNDPGPADDSLAHYLNNDLNRFDHSGDKEDSRSIIENIRDVDEDFGSGEKNIRNEDEDSRIEDESLGHYAENDLNRKKRVINRPLIKNEPDDDDLPGLRISPKRRGPNALITNLNIDDDIGNSLGGKADKKKKKEE